MSGSWHEVAVIVAKPISLPRYDPQWNANCLQCIHVRVEIQEGVRVLRCNMARMVGGGGRVRADLKKYCLEVLNEDCKKNGWFQSANDNGATV